MTDTSNRTIKFMVPGRRRSGKRGVSSTDGEPLPPGMSGVVKDSVDVSSSRSSGKVQIEATEGEEVVLIQLENGPELYLHPAHAKELFLANGDGGKRDSGKSGDDLVDVPIYLSWDALKNEAANRGSSRGFIKNVALKTIKIVSRILGNLPGALATEKAGKIASEKLSKLIDGQVKEGIYKLIENSPPMLKGQNPLKTFPDQSATIAGTLPVLVLIHGTFSSTAGSFGKLWAHFPDQIHDLFEHYKQQVYALDHETVSVSPIDNALTLVDACESGTQLHLLTHSRGGLVAEVLVRAASLSAVEDATKQLTIESQNKTLSELIQKIRDKQISLKRVVRVACPARGTLLASNRLDVYLSVFRWTLQLARIPVLPVLMQFIEEIAARRLLPEEMPGLAAMVPDSPLIDWLHAAEEPVAGELRVIAGDMRGESVGSWLKTLVADAFFWTDNDLVVHTRSMYGGVARQGENASRFVFDSGGQVTHFGYFENEITASAIFNGLTQGEPTDFEPIGPLSYAGESSDGMRGEVQRPDPAKPAVFVIPGILGSHLALNDKRIWLSWRWFFRLHKLKYPEPSDCTIEPDGAIGTYYDDLQKFLRQSHDVHEFSFDWRLPIEQEAVRLSKSIAAALDDRNMTGQPVRIIAHSMGGILARALQIAAPSVWDRLLSHDQARILFLGTPHEGSWAPMQILTGDDTFGNRLIGFGSASKDHEGRQAVAGFPGLLQLQAGLLDERNLGHEETWIRLAEQDQEAARRYKAWHHNAYVDKNGDYYKWGIPPQQVLDKARSFRQLLDKQKQELSATHRGKLFNILGIAPSTPDGFKLTAERGLEYADVNTGDGRVTHQNAMFDDTQCWQTLCSHGKLPDCAEAFSAYLDILQSGNTDKLSLAAAREQNRGASGTTSITGYSRPSRSINHLVLPSGEDFSTPEKPSRQETQHVDLPTLHVTVENADLTFVRDSLLLGHYRAPNLHGTEWAANELINGTMQESLALGQYPDQPGTNRIFANLGVDRDSLEQTQCPDCVIVVGLGDEGSLKNDELINTVKMGVLARAQQHLESVDETPQDFRIASTLLASGGYGVSAALSAQQIVKGVLEANQAIDDINLAFNEGSADRRWPMVSHLRLVELYSSRATDAWLALNDLARDSGTRISVQSQVKTGTGAMKRLGQHGYRGTSSDMLSALAPDDNSSIRYTVATQRARTEVSAQSTQARLVKQLVHNASNETHQDPRLSLTLFKLLMPEAVQTIVNGASELLLELDDSTAGIPWELLDSKARRISSEREDSQQNLPWAIRCKLIRKLQLSNFRNQPFDAHRESSVLIIGEPDCDPEKYGRLPGARQEARAIRDELVESDVVDSSKIKSLIGQEGEGKEVYRPGTVEILTTLLNEEWRIVHIAGHGEPPTMPEPGDADRHRQANSGEHGVVLSDRTFLGPNEIKGVGAVPELVFMNCCHLASSDSESLLKRVEAHRYDRAEFAAGIARNLIEIGVKCVVAAGWAVEDNAAKLFATTFYAQLIEGERFCDAVAEARKSALRMGGNTWAAYQCYGDPDWTLTSKRRRSGTGKNRFREFDDIGTVEALVVELENIRTRGENPNRKFVELTDALNELHRRFDKRWSERGMVAEAFADAWAAVGNMDAAIKWYENARNAVDGRGSVRASERLFNLQVRHAWAAVQKIDRQRKESASKDKAVLKALKTGAKSSTENIEFALTKLEQLLEIKKTPERYALCGSAYKRLAMIARLAGTRKEEKAALEQMLASYEYAEKLDTSDTSTRNKTYFLQNVLYASFVIGAFDDNWKGLEVASINELRDRFVQARAEDTNFWSEVGIIETRMLSLINKSLVPRRKISSAEFDSGIDQIIRQFKDLHDRVQSREKWSSVADQMAFVTQGYGRRVSKHASEEKIDSGKVDELAEMIHGFGLQATA